MAVQRQSKLNGLRLFAKFVNAHQTIYSDMKIIKHTALAFAVVLTINGFFNPILFMFAVMSSAIYKSL